LLAVSFADHKRRIAGAQTGAIRLPQLRAISAQEHSNG
jgi:hypothetical protein